MDMDRSVKIFQTPFVMAEKMSGILTSLVNSHEDKSRPFTIALSGGSTPVLFFSVLAGHFGSQADWSQVHFYWADERCVAPDHHDSNYRMAREALFDNIKIPAENIHRIRGEAEPESEVLRYSEEISGICLLKNGLPAFDLILLGLGEDGHTASIFPGTELHADRDMACMTTMHPVSRQMRISLTMPVINNATHVIFMVSGRNKAGIVSEIMHPGEPGQLYPASIVNPVAGSLQWLLDRDAASLLTI